MLKEWQFNILFFVGVGGAILMLVGPSFGINVATNPTAVTGIGAILTYVLTQKKAIVADKDEKKGGEHKKEGDKAVKNDRGQEGYTKASVVEHVVLVLVVFITAFAAFSAAQTNQRLEQTVACLTRFNTNQNETLASRDQAIKDETQAEIYLWTLYDELGEIAANGTRKEVKLAEERFREAVLEYRDQLVETQRARSAYGYDDPDVLKDCKERTR